jgi:hypothetical protein
MVQLIVIAQGIQIRDSGQGTALQTFLAANCDRKGSAPPAGANNTWLFPKGAAAAKATHEIRVVYSMPDLKAALDIDDAWVIYEGHSRYGQGPAFGPAGIAKVPDKKAFPVNPWGVHFKMGYDATDTECLGDLTEHSVVPAEYDLTTVDPTKAFIPEALVSASTNVQAQQKSIKAKKIKPAAICGLPGAWRSMDVCQPKRAATKTARGDEPMKGRHFYVHQRPGKPNEEFLTAVPVGSGDLDASKLACALFFMASCSSKVHFHAALKRRRAAVKSSCRFLLTGEVCATSHATKFLEQVLVKKLNPTTAKELKTIVRVLNGEAAAGNVGVY